jgi:hypothetical protein
MSSFEVWRFLLWLGYPSMRPREKCIVTFDLENVIFILPYVFSAWKTVWTDQQRLILKVLKPVDVPI